MRILIAYATADGQTRKIADFLARHLRERSHAVELCDLALPPGGLDPAAFEAVVVASSMRMGKYRPAVEAFARRYRDVLARAPSAFVSVSLAAANIRNREQALGALKKRVEQFAERTGWTPARVHHAAGGLPYTRYNFLTRWVMRRIARDQGYDTDTRRDYEYTDWNALARFADAFVASAQ